MTTELAQAIAVAPLVSTHEHLQSERSYTEKPPDILQNLFHNYVLADLVVAGAEPATVDALIDAGNPDIAARFRGVEPAWQLVRHTGYGEAVGIIAREFYGLEELTAGGLATAQATTPPFGQPGERLRILRDRAGLDHVQIDHMRRTPETSPDADFFLYDISMVNFCNGMPDLEPLYDETGIEVDTLARLGDVMAAVFAQNAAQTIAVKSQHAYSRTLRWAERSDREAARVFAAYLAAPDAVSYEDRVCLGDWCLARTVELCIEHNLPFKIHTGYYAGHSRMPVDYVKAGHLSPLLARYPDARFVLMHIAYPYQEELLALAKHYPNVAVDLCWAWSINPYAAADFVRRFVHAAPANKLFAFGGDTQLPAATLAYARQARHWLTRALQAEVDDGLLSEQEAIWLASRIMRDNQYDYFDLPRKKAALRRQSTLDQERSVP